MSKVTNPRCPPPNIGIRLSGHIPHVYVSPTHALPLLWMSHLVDARGPTDLCTSPATRSRDNNIFKMKLKFYRTIDYCFFSLKIRLKYVRRSRFWNYCFPCLLRLGASSSSSTSSGFRNGEDANRRSTCHPLTTFTGAGVTTTGVEDPDDSATTTTTTTRVSRRLRVAAAGVTGRRHSSTPYVKSSLNVVENEILLKHVRRRRLEDRDSEDEEEATTDSG